jgi:hypothetical protein
MPALRWSLALRCLCACLPLLLVGAARWRAQAVSLDGHRDAAYALLAVDPADDLAPTLAAQSPVAWAELSALYVTTDTTNLYVYVALPNYAQASASGEIGLVIVTTDDIGNSGGASDPGGNDITFAYTATHANTGTVPVDATQVILPEIVIRGDVPGTAFEDAGRTVFFRWNGASWSGGDTNWGGIGGLSTVGTHVAYFNGEGVEFSIPYTDLQVPPETLLSLQFFTAPRQVFFNGGAYDTVPSDDQIALITQTTTLRRLATLVPPPPCAAAALGDSAVITETLVHDDTNLLYRDPLGALAPGAAATLRLRACAGDLQAVNVLVWANANPFSGPPAHTYPLTATAAGANVVWSGAVPASNPPADQWYQFSLADGGPAGYVHPAAGDTGPAGWSAVLSALAWRLPTLPSLRLFLPGLLRP